MTASISPLIQTVGDICAGLAAVVVLLPLPRLRSQYASTYPRTNQWVPSALYMVIPLWLLLMGALFCVTASGGFDWLRLGRPAEYAFTVAPAFALAGASFVFVALYIRPGFTPHPRPA